MPKGFMLENGNTLCFYQCFMILSHVDVGTICPSHVSFELQCLKVQSQQAQGCFAILEEWDQHHV